MNKIEANFEETIKDKFHKIAKSNGLSDAEYLRIIVLNAIQEYPNIENLSCEPDYKNTEIDRTTVRMPHFLIEAAKVRAKSRGMVLSRWIASLVQSNLMRNPVMTNKQLGVLRLSNWQLASIGRNINQIARTLNEAFYKTEAVRLEKLAELDRAIKENKKIIYELIKASQNDWRAD